MDFSMRCAAVTVNGFSSVLLVHCWPFLRAVSWPRWCRRSLPAVSILHEQDVAINIPTAHGFGAHARMGDRLLGLDLRLAGSNHFHTIAVIVRSSSARTRTGRRFWSARNARTPRE